MSFFNPPNLPMSIPNKLNATTINNYIFIKIGSMGAFALIPYAHINLLNFIRVIIKEASSHPLKNIKWFGNLGACELDCWE